MKLRNRQKRASDNIKQEDYKPNFTSINVSSSTVDEPNACDYSIKQEDVKNQSNLLKQDDEFEGKEYYYRCDVCKQKMPSIQSVMEHRKSVHNVKSVKISIIKDTSTEPDIHDPNFHCQSCNLDYKDGNRYRSHLRNVHFMILKTIPSHKTPRNSIVPDPDDPNLHCRACDNTFSYKTTYKQHCRYIHGMTSVKLGIKKSTLDGITDTYCKLCDTRLSSKAAYKMHLSAIHRLDWRLTRQKPKNIVPDVDDPNFYCCACETTLGSKMAFKNHLLLVHSIYPSAPKKTNLEPDIDDPNYDCRTCHRNYRSKGEYRRHLRYVHQIALTPLRGNVNPEILPDPNDPHYYCSVCKKNWTTRGRYRSHCRGTHFMILGRQTIANPNAEININDPNFYCAQCERSYNTTSSFKCHLRQVHDI
ncbi:hypothetical protein PS6_009481 [Mucor atramentarius]